MPAPEWPAALLYGSGRHDLEPQSPPAPAWTLLTPPPILPVS